MEKKTETRKKFGRICALVVVGMFVAMSLPTSVVAPAGTKWDQGGNNNTVLGDQLGPTNNVDLVIVAGGNGMVGGGTQRMVVNWNTGNVGIGLPGTPAAPPTAQARLHVDFATNPAANTYIEIARVGDVSPAVDKAVGMGVYGAAGDPAIQAIDQTNPEEYSWPLYINPKGTNTILNFETGNVGIGQTTPETKLHVEGTITVDQKIMADDSGGLELATDEGTTRLFIKDDGNIGIGTTSPDKKLSVIGVVRGAYNTAETEYTEIGHGGSHGYINTVGDGNLDFRHDGSTKMSLTDSGKVGIGTTSPTQALHVAGNARITGALYDSNNDAGTNGQILQTSGSGIDWVDLSPVPDDDWIISGDDMYSGVSGNVGIGTSYPNNPLEISSSTSPQFRISQGDPNEYVAFSVNTVGRLDITTVDIGGTGGNICLLPDEPLGKVGVGTTSPSNKFSVSGDADFSGKVGIGTTDPNNPLEISSSTSPQFRISNEDTQPDYATFSVDSDGQLDITTRDRYGSKGHICLMPDGNVGIGTTDPNNPLEIRSSTSPQFSISNGDLNDYANFSLNSLGRLDITTVDGSGTRGHICLMPDGNVGIGTTNPWPTNKLSVIGNANFTGSVGIGVTTSQANAKLHVSHDDLYAGYFTSNKQSGFTEVIHAEYIGAGNCDATAVYGKSVPADWYGLGGYFEGGYRGVTGIVNPTGSGYYHGVYGKVAGGSGDNYGVFGEASGSGINYGVRGESSASVWGSYGVYGAATGNSGIKYGVYGKASGSGTNWAGYFSSGNVYIQNNLGIGTTSPYYKLTIGDGTYERLHFSGSTNPTKPPYGSVVIYFDGEDLKVKNSSGTVKKIADF